VTNRLRTLAVRVTAVVLAAVVVAMAAATTSAQITSAQTSSAEWAFAPKGIFADDRVVQSMRVQMDTDAAAAAGGVSLAYLGGAELFTTPADALPLLWAAGILGHDATTATDLNVIRACHVWSGGASDAEADALATTAAVIGAELSRVWGALGVSFAPCEATGDAAVADLLVFPAGDPPAGLDFLGYDPAGSFLASQPLPGAIPGGGTGGGPAGEAGGPAPAWTGSLGIAPDALGGGHLAWAVLVTIALVGLARVLTGRRARAG
jgi:hypothetical protein